MNERESNDPFSRGVWEILLIIFEIYIDKKVCKNTCNVIFKEKMCNVVFKGKIYI